MKKISLIIIFLLTVSLVFAVDSFLSNENKEYRQTSKDTYEVWELKEKINVKEKEKELNDMNEYKTELETTTKFYDNCINECKRMCGVDYDYTTFLEGEEVKKEDYVNDCIKTCDFDCEDMTNRELDIISYVVNELQEEYDELKELK